ncbi:MAG: ATP-dependent RecD-like DNA helicase [Candidatus Tectomicrobia bacterium]|uniref:ATP-dependent RecD-like DNA helicase n=1 Tax=Tectimicrobiota bacterium TaxID=2528274 RepID=A0A932GND9_UNCTE|nr:ATP-dependent RecD-like DNA helicase [Candidatus Tectomicrobia bacterium]
MEFIQGAIERIVYRNEETLYTVARFRPDPDASGSLFHTAAAQGAEALVTLVGHLPALQPGEALIVNGHWTTHPVYGRQFKVEGCQWSPPTSRAGIQQFLSSGLIQGIGPVMAKRLVDAFGLETLRIIEEEPARLHEVNGIGPQRAEAIALAWQKHQGVKSLMLFLQPHGATPSQIFRIHHAYGDSALAVLRENPYRLATEVRGSGFVTADRLAQKLGFPKDSPLRAESGLLYVLQEFGQEGHICAPYQQLVEKSCALLEISSKNVQEGLARAATHRHIVLEEIKTAAGPVKAVYPRHLHAAEVRVAQKLKQLLSTPRISGSPVTDWDLQWIQDLLGIRFAPRQLEAVTRALGEKVLVITGGPGTGKTTLLHSVVRLYQRLGQRILLAAPTGRAAKRLAEATNEEARTIHRLLEFNPQQGGFQRGPTNRLKADVFVIDETSMVDLPLMDSLLQAIPDEATVIFIGDANQLPSVGPGNVLRDIIASERIPVVTLTEIFRQARGSLIVENAHRINQGELPFLPQGDQRESADFHFIHEADPDKILRLILDLCSEILPHKRGLHPIDDIQVLTPMHRGPLGTVNLNEQLQQRLNPSRNDDLPAGFPFRLRDKVMQIRNNYQKEIFNGDIGRITAIDSERGEICVNFDQREVLYESGELDELTPAYAVSIHKAQGSEYPGIIVPLTTQHFPLLQRNVIYTAVTRGKKLVILIGTTRALTIAIKSNQIQSRHTFLAQRLRDSG